MKTIKLNLQSFCEEEEYKNQIAYFTFQGPGDVKLVINGTVIFQGEGSTSIFDEKTYIKKLKKMYKKEYCVEKDENGKNPNYGSLDILFDI